MTSLDVPFGLWVQLVGQKKERKALSGADCFMKEFILSCSWVGADLRILDLFEKGALVQGRPRSKELEQDENKEVRGNHEPH